MSGGACESADLLWQTSSDYTSNDDKNILKKYWIFIECIIKPMVKISNYRSEYIKYEIFFKSKTACESKHSRI